MSEWKDEDVQAFVDGELPADEAMALERAMADDAVLAARVAFVRAVGGATEDGLAAAFGPAGRAEGTAGCGSASGLPAASGQGKWLGLVLAAAAALVVFSIWRSQRDTDPVVIDQAVENRFFAVRCVPRHGGTWDLFSAVAVQLDWAAQPRPDAGGTTWTVHVLGAGTAAGDVIDAATDAIAVPVRLTARIEGPGGAVWNAVWRGEPFSTTGRESQVVPLWEFEIDDPGLSPLIFVAPKETGWLADPNWGIGAMAAGPGPQRFVPQEPGEYRVVLELTSIPVVDGRAWQAFAKPLVVESTLRIEATVGEWSEPVDGMRARLVVPRAHMRGRAAQPLVLQLRNDSDRVRTYNALGITMVDIPQPFHFDLVVDGVAWGQGHVDGPTIPAGILMREHAPGTLHSLVVPMAHWAPGGDRAGDGLQRRPGDHRLQFRFENRMLVRLDSDRSIWEGEISTPPVEVSVAR